MAQALSERAVNGNHETRSAGTEPAGRVHPEVVEVRAVGLDLKEQTPEKLDTGDAEWGGRRGHYGLRRRLPHRRQAVHLSPKPLKC